MVISDEFIRQITITKISLAQRHQNLQLYLLLSVDYFQFLDLGTEQEVDSCIKDFVSMSLMRQDKILTINSEMFNLLDYLIDYTLDYIID